MSYAQTHIEASQAEARRSQWRGPAGAARRFKQRGLHHPIRHSNKTSLRRCYAIQPQQQRSFAGFVALYERKEGVDISGRLDQGQEGIDRPLSAGANGARDASQQGKLVRPDLVCARQHHWAGNYRAILASWSICPLDPTSKDKSQKEATPTGNTASVLREQEKAFLSVHRINRPPYISVHRIRAAVCLSVHRIYAGCFQWFPLSVHRTPSSNTTTSASFPLVGKDQL